MKKTVTVLLLVCAIATAMASYKPPTKTIQETAAVTVSGPSQQTAEEWASQETERQLVEFLQAAATTTTTTVKPRPVTAANFAPGDGSRWDQLAACECGGNWACNTGNGFGGGLQFMHQSNYSTWRSFGGTEFTEHPWQASREQQIVVAERVLARSGWAAWPGCSRKFGWL
jgi:hypothetical protein